MVCCLSEHNIHMVIACSTVGFSEVGDLHSLRRLC
jgi:hypothetical protein